MKNNVYYIIAGEPSGDLHGRSLIKEIKKLDSSAKFLGLGGPLMQEVGLETSIDFKRLSVMGFFEVLKDIRFFCVLVGDHDTKKNYRSELENRIKFKGLTNRVKITGHCRDMV